MSCRIARTAASVSRGNNAPGIVSRRALRRAKSSDPLYAATPTGSGGTDSCYRKQQPLLDVSNSRRRSEELSRGATLARFRPPECPIEVISRACFGSAGIADLMYRHPGCRRRSGYPGQPTGRTTIDPQGDRPLPAVWGAFAPPAATSGTGTIAVPRSASPTAMRPRVCGSRDAFTPPASAPAWLRTLLHPPAPERRRASAAARVRRIEESGPAGGPGRDDPLP